MNYGDIQVGMLVYLAEGYQWNFEGCVGRVIAKQHNKYTGTNILLDFSLNGNKPPFEGHKDFIPLDDRNKYDMLPEALDEPKYKSRWWVNHDYITEAYSDVVLDGGLL
jgi:hypothetical protein